MNGMDRDLSERMEIEFEEMAERERLAKLAGRCTHGRGNFIGDQVFKCADCGKVGSFNEIMNERDEILAEF